VQHAHQTVLACMKPCITNGKDATIEVTSYKGMSTVIYIDLQTIQCVVGRVECAQDWFIIDCSGGTARTVFVDPEDNDE
ncbi:hypothetical protein BU17DRAFT_39900, partial [Hysterangium stoloniferum]